MKELKEFDQLIESMKNKKIQEDAVIFSNDFGGYQNLNYPDLMTGETYLEKGMSKLIGDITIHSMNASKAKKEVETAIKELLTNKALEEMPNEDASDGAKARWLQMSVPRIKGYLELKGIIPHGF